jgi:hypothetical protein
VVELGHSAGSIKGVKGVVKRVSIPDGEEHREAREERKRERKILPVQFKLPETAYLMNMSHGKVFLNLSPFYSWTTRTHCSFSLLHFSTYHCLKLRCF